MRFDNHILVIISIVSLFFVIIIEGKDSSPPSSKEDEIYDEVKKAFGPNFDDAKEKFGPVSSLDLEQFEEAKDAFGPIPSVDEAKEALGPASSSILEKAKEALGPVSPAALEEAKEALGPASSKAKESLGPSSSKVIDKAREKLDMLASWITQNKEDIPSEAQKQVPEPTDAPTPVVSPLDPYGLLDGAKEKFDSLLDSITQEKEQISSSLLDEAQNESGPVSYRDIALDKAQKKKGPHSFDMDTSSPSSSSTHVSYEGSNLSKMLDEAKEKSGSITSLINQNKEEIFSDSPSISARARKELRPGSSSPSPISAPAPAPVFPTFEEAKVAIGSYSSKALDAAKEKFSTLTSYISQNKMQMSPESGIKLRSTSVYLDHDVALAVESMIKQAQSNTELAIDEAKTLLSDPIDSSDTGKCVTKCMASYESCSNKLNKAMEDLRARNVEMLKDDIGAVEGEINACQKCFQENTNTQSPFSDLEEDTIKATHECLNVLGHSA